MIHGIFLLGFGVWISRTGEARRWAVVQICRGELTNGLLPVERECNTFYDQSEELVSARPCVFRRIFLESLIS
jgi:hypothetical protein